MMNQRSASLKFPSVSPRYVLAVIIGITVVFNNIEWSLGGNNLTLERLLAAPIFLMVVLLLVSSNIPCACQKQGCPEHLDCTGFLRVCFGPGCGLVAENVCRFTVRGLVLLCGYLVKG